MKVFVCLLLVAVAFAEEGPSQIYSAPPPNPQPGPPQPSGPNFGPPPPPSLAYGPPPPPPSGGPSFLYGPPPPLPSTPLDFQPLTSYGSSLSLFDGECGYWKALSTFLVVGIGLTGLAILFRVWPLPFSFLPADATSRLNDPDFITSVIDQASDITRILSAISDATVKEE